MCSARQTPESVRHAGEGFRRQSPKGREVSPEMPMDRAFQKRVKDVEAQ
nr:hypothetical protein [uncultured Bacteroides sp.]